jgi:DNA polymerase-3 subunit beta
MTMTAKQVRQALTRLKRVRATRSTVQVLTTIRIDESGLHATDMEAHLTIHADTGIDRAVQVDPMQLAGALKGLKASDPVVFESIAGALGVRVNGITLPGADPADWPEWHALAGAMRVGLPDGVFDAMLDVAVAAVSTDESRPVLTGVHLEARGDSIRVSATDSYRLARVMLHGGDALQGIDMVLPVKGGKYLQAIGSATGIGAVDAAGEVCAWVDLYSDDAVLSLRRIVGQFPNVDQLIPEASFYTGFGCTDGLLNPVRTIAGVASRYAPLELMIEGGALSVGFGSGELIVDPVVASRGIVGEDMLIGANAAYLEAGLRFVGDNAPLRFISPLRPMLLGSEYERCYLLMPVRLGESVRERIAKRDASPVGVVA